MHSIHDKLAKVYALVNNGATEGERTAAKKALDRLMEKYNLSDDALREIELKEYLFTYTTTLELGLFYKILTVMVPEALPHTKIRRWNKRYVVKLNYANYVTIECAYEYFRRHMKKQWNKVAAEKLKRIRKNKNKVIRRKELQDHFFDVYCIASKLYKEEELVTASFKSKSEFQDRMMMNSVEGGNYNKQIIGNLLLTE